MTPLRYLTERDAKRVRGWTSRHFESTSNLTDTDTQRSTAEGYGHVCGRTCIGETVLWNLVKENCFQTEICI